MTSSAYRPVRSEARRRPRLSLERSLILLTMSAIVLTVGLSAAHLLADRQARFSEGQRNAINLTSAFEEHLRLVIKLIDDTLIVARTQGKFRDPADLRALLSARPALQDVVLQLSVSDRAGNVLASTVALDGPVNIADRENFRHFAESDDDDLHTGKPVFGRISHHWAIPFTRRLSDAQGQFDGVIVISIEPAYLTKLYSSIDVGPAGTIATIGMDGVIRARAAHGVASFGEAVPPDVVAKDFAWAEGGIVRIKSPVDGVQRLQAFKRVHDYPLVVTVGLAVDDVLAPFYRELWSWVAWEAASALLIVGMGGLALRRVRAERKHEERLRRSEQAMGALKRRYELILGAASDGILGVSADGKVIFANPAACRLMGYRAEDILGVSYVERFYGAERCLYPQRLIQAHPKGESGEVHECEVTRADGSTFIAEFSVAPIVGEDAGGGLVLAFRDVSLRKQYEEAIANHQRELERQVSERTAKLSSEIKARESTEEALRKSQARLLGITANLFEAVVLVDATGHLLFVNRSAYRLLAVGSGQLTGIHLDEVFRLLRNNLPVDFADSPFCRVLTGDSETLVDNDAAFLRHDGRRLAVAFACSPLDEDGKRPATIVSFRSIEALKRAQREALQSSRLASVGQLAAGIAHEINTPIQYVGDNLHFIDESLASLERAIQGTKACLDAPEVPAEVRSRLMALLEACDVDFLLTETSAAAGQALEGVLRVSHVVRSMREFSHPGSAAKSLTDINRSIDSTITVTSNAWKHVARIETDLADDLPPIVCLAADINQVLLNLVINAAQAIESVGSAEPGTIRITSRRQGDVIEIRVADNGPGVPPELRERIYDPFFTTKAVGKGTGQGLAICMDVVVTKHQGRLFLDDTVEGGATFVVQLPISLTEDGEPASD
jgi:PAS domain S-box-containing protein